MWRFQADGIDSFARVDRLVSERQTLADELLEPRRHGWYTPGLRNGVVYTSVVSETGIRFGVTCSKVLMV
jgi:hypothetical protein